MNKTNNKIKYVLGLDTGIDSFEYSVTSDEDRNSKIVKSANMVQPYHGINPLIK